MLRLCQWKWPQETTTIHNVCKISTGTLENSASGYCVNRLKATCDDYTCKTDVGSIFIHTTSIATLDMKAASSKIETDALCTSDYCIVPSSMSLYKAERILPGIEGWYSGFVSTTGEVIYLKNNPKGGSSQQSRSRIDTPEDIKKIMYLEEESLRLGHKTDMLCHIIQQLKTLF